MQLERDRRVGGAAQGAWSRSGCGVVLCILCRSRVVIPGGTRDTSSRVVSRVICVVTSIFINTFTFTTTTNNNSAIVIVSVINSSDGVKNGVNSGGREEEQ